MRAFHAGLSVLILAFTVRAAEPCRFVDQRRNVTRIQDEPERRAAAEAVRSRGVEMGAQSAPRADLLPLLAFGLIIDDARCRKISEDSSSLFEMAAKYGASSAPRFRILGVECVAGVWASDPRDDAEAAGRDAALDYLWNAIVHMDPDGGLSFFGIFVLPGLLESAAKQEAPGLLSAIRGSALWGAIDVQGLKADASSIHVLLEPTPPAVTTVVKGDVDLANMPDPSFTIQLRDTIFTREGTVLAAPHGSIDLSWWASWLEDDARSRVYMYPGAGAKLTGALDFGQPEVGTTKLVPYWSTVRVSDGGLYVAASGYESVPRCPAVRVDGGLSLETEPGRDTTVHFTAVTSDLRRVAPDPNSKPRLKAVQWTAEGAVASPTEESTAITFDTKSYPVHTIVRRKVTVSAVDHDDLGAASCLNVDIGIFPLRDFGRRLTWSPTYERSQWPTMAILRPMTPASGMLEMRVGGRLGVAPANTRGSAPASISFGVTDRISLAIGTEGGVCFANCVHAVDDAAARASFQVIRAPAVDVVVTAGFGEQRMGDRLLDRAEARISSRVLLPPLAIQVAPAILFPVDGESAAVELRRMELPAELQIQLGTRTLTAIGVALSGPLDRACGTGCGAYRVPVSARVQRTVRSNLDLGVEAGFSDLLGASGSARDWSVGALASYRL